MAETITSAFWEYNSENRTLSYYESATVEKTETTTGEGEDAVTTTTYALAEGNTDTAKFTLAIGEGQQVTDLKSTIETPNGISFTIEGDDNKDENSDGTETTEKKVIVSSITVTEDFLKTYGTKFTINVLAEDDAETGSTYGVWTFNNTTSALTLTVSGYITSLTTGDGDDTITIINLATSEQTVTDNETGAETTETVIAVEPTITVGKGENVVDIEEGTVTIYSGESTSNTFNINNSENTKVTSVTFYDVTESDTIVLNTEIKDWSNAVDAEDDETSELNLGNVTILFDVTDGDETGIASVKAVSNKVQIKNGTNTSASLLSTFLPSGSEWYQVQINGLTAIAYGVVSDKENPSEEDAKNAEVLIWGLGGLDANSTLEPSDIENPITIEGNTIKLSKNDFSDNIESSGDGEEGNSGTVYVGYGVKEGSKWTVEINDDAMSTESAATWSVDDGTATYSFGGKTDGLSEMGEDEQKEGLPNYEGFTFNYYTYQSEVVAHTLSFTGLDTDADELNDLDTDAFKLGNITNGTLDLTIGKAFLDLMSGNSLDIIIDVAADGETNYAETLDKLNVTLTGVTEGAIYENEHYVRVGDTVTYDSDGNEAGYSVGTGDDNGQGYETNITITKTGESTIENYATITGVSEGAPTKGENNISASTGIISVPKEFVDSDSQRLTVTVNEDFAAEDRMNFDFNEISGVQNYTVKVGSGKVKLTLGEVPATVEIDDALTDTLVVAGNGAVTYYLKNDDIKLTLGQDLRNGDAIKLDTETTAKISNDKTKLILGSIEITLQDSNGNDGGELFTDISIFTGVKVYNGTKETNLLELINSTLVWSTEDTEKCDYLHGNPSGSYVAVEGLTDGKLDTLEDKTKFKDNTYQVRIDSELANANDEIKIQNKGNDQDYNNKNNYQFTFETAISSVQILRDNISVINDTNTGEIFKIGTAGGETAVKTVSVTTGQGADTIIVGANASDVTITSGGGADKIIVLNDEITLTDLSTNYTFLIESLNIEFKDEQTYNTYYQTTVSYETETLEGAATATGKLTFQRSGSGKSVVVHLSSVTETTRADFVSTYGNLSVINLTTDSVNDKTSSYDNLGTPLTLTAITKEPPSYEWKIEETTEGESTNRKYYFMANGTKLGELTGLDTSTVTTEKWFDTNITVNEPLLNEGDAKKYELVFSKDALATLESNATKKYSFAFDSSRTDLIDAETNKPKFEVTFAVPDNTQLGGTFTDQDAWSIDDNHVATRYSAGSLAGYNISSTTNGNNGLSQPSISYVSADSNNLATKQLSLSNIANSVTTAELNNDSLEIEEGGAKNITLPAGIFDTTKTATIKAEGYTVTLSDAAKVAMSTEVSNGTIIGSESNDTLIVGEAANSSTIQSENKIKLDGGKGDDIITLQNVTAQGTLEVYGGEGADTINITDMPGESQNFVSVVGGSLTEDDQGESKIEDTENDTFIINNSKNVKIISGDNDADTFVIKGSGSNVEINLGKDDKISLANEIKADNIYFDENDNVLVFGKNTVSVTGADNRAALYTAGLYDLKVFNGEDDTEGTALRELIDKVGWHVKTDDNGSSYYLIYGEEDGDTQVKITGLDLANLETTKLDEKQIKITETEGKYKIELATSIIGDWSTPEAKVEVKFTEKEDATYNSGNTVLALMDETKEFIEYPETWTIGSDDEGSSLSAGSVQYSAAYQTGEYKIAEDKQSITKGEITTEKDQRLAFTLSGLNTEGLTTKTETDEDGTTKTVVPGIDFKADETATTITLSKSVLVKNTKTRVKVNVVSGSLADVTYTLALGTDVTKVEPKPKWTAEKDEENSVYNATYALEAKNAGFTVDEENHQIIYSLEDSGTKQFTITGLNDNLVEDSGEFAGFTVGDDGTITITKSAVPDGSAEMQDIKLEFAPGIVDTEYKLKLAETGDDSFSADDLSQTTNEGWQAAAVAEGETAKKAVYHTGGVSKGYKVADDGLSITYIADATPDTTPISIDGLNLGTGDNPFEDLNIDTKTNTIDIGQSLLTNTADNTTSSLTVEGDETTTDTAYSVSLNAAATVELKRNNTNIIGSDDGDSIKLGEDITEITTEMKLDGGTGADLIEADAGNLDEGHLTIKDDGQLSLVGGAGEDSINAKDITVNSNSALYIDGGADNDSITVENVKVADSAENAVISISGGAGDDSISLKDGKGVYIDGGDGDDNISIIGGDSNTINAGAGDNLTFSGTVTATITGLTTDATITVPYLEFATFDKDVSYDAEGGELKLGDSISLNIGKFKDKDELLKEYGKIKLKSTEQSDGKALI